MRPEGACRAGAVAVPLYCHEISGLYYSCGAAMGPTALPIPARSSPSATRNPRPTLCEAQWKSMAALPRVTCMLETMRDQCRFQFATKMTNMSSDERQMWVSASWCSHPLHIHLPFPATGQASFRHQAPHRTKSSAKTIWVPLLCKI